jgi:hypothetical protein
MTTIRALRTEELGSILDYVHDRAFDLSRIELNARDRSLTIPIKLRSNRSKKRLSWFSLGGREETTTGTMVIRKALGYRILDDAGIGEGDINTIELRGNKIFVTGSIPVQLVVDVEGLEIELSLPIDAKLA